MNWRVATQIPSDRYAYHGITERDSAKVTELSYRITQALFFPAMH